MLQKRDRIIASIRKQHTSYLKKNHKFGIELLKTVEHALALDSMNDKTLWADTISKEMENIRVALKVLTDGKSMSICHQFVQCHMVFDIKMEDFKQEA